MRLQILLVSVLASTTHGFMFNPLMMALQRYRMGGSQSSMLRSPFNFNRGGIMETIRRNQQAILNRRRDMIRNRMGMGNRGVSQRQLPQATTGRINPKRLEPFGGKLGGMQSQVNVLSGIAQQVPNNAMIQAQTPRATNMMAPHQQLLATVTRNVAPSVTQQLPNVGMRPFGGKLGRMQSQVNVLSGIAQQVPNNAMIRAQTLRATNMRAPQQQLSATVTRNVAPSVIEVAQQLPNVGMGPFGGRLGGIPPPVMTVNNRAGVHLNQPASPSANNNNRRSNMIVGPFRRPQATSGGAFSRYSQILSAPSNATPRRKVAMSNVLNTQQQQVAMSNILNTQQRKLAQNKVIGQVQATNVMAVPQQQLGATLTTNVRPSVIQVAQQVPNLAMSQAQTPQALNVMAHQQRFGTTLITKSQVPNVAMGQAQTSQARKVMTPQQQLGGTITTNVRPSVVEVAQQVPNSAMGQAQTFQALNVMAPRQQFGATLIANAQVPNVERGKAKLYQAIQVMAPQQQLGGTITTNVGPSVVEVAQQVPNSTMGQAQTLQSLNVMEPQQQLGATITANIGAPVIEVAQQQFNVATDQTQTLQGSNVLTADPLQQQTLLNQYGPSQQITVSDPQLANIDYAIASTQQELRANQNGIAEAKLQEQIIEANNQAAQQQAQLRIGELGSMVINPTQQQLINAGNTIDRQQQAMGSTEQLQQQQFLEMNNAMQNQATNAFSPFPQQRPNFASRFVQQLLNLQNGNLQQQTMSNTFPVQPDMSNSAGQQTQLLDMSNMVQNPVPEILSQSLQQQTVDVNNAIGQLGQLGSPEIGSNVVFDPSLQIASDIGMQQQIGSNIVTDPLSVNLDQRQGLNVMSGSAQQQQTLADASNMLMAEPIQQQQTLVDMTNPLNPEQQMGLATTGSNIVIDPLQQQQAVGELQPIGTNLVSGTKEQLPGTSFGQQTSFGSNPMNFQQQVILDPIDPFDPLWSFGSATGGIPYMDPLQELALARDPYAQQLLYSNPVMIPSFVSGVPLTPVEPKQIQQSGISSASQQGSFVPAQDSFTAQQQALNTQLQQTGAFGGIQSQFGPWDQIQPQNTPWLSNLQPDPNQPYMANAAVQQQTSTGEAGTQQQQQYQPPQTLQLVETVQQPQSTGTQITSSAENLNTPAGNSNTASSSQLSATSLGSPATPKTASSFTDTIQQNAQLSDQSLQYRQAILDSILSSLKPQVVYNPLSGLDVPVDSSAGAGASTATSTAGAGPGASRVLQKESALPSVMSAQQPTSPQPSFTVSDVIRSLASGGQVSNLPFQKTIFADKKTANGQTDQQVFMSNQVDMTSVTTASPLSVATLSPTNYDVQTPVQNAVYNGMIPERYVQQPVYTQSAYIPSNDFWNEMALASAIFNHPKQSLTPKQGQKMTKKEKQQEMKLNSLIQSMMLASLLPENSAVKQAPSAFKTSPVVTRGDLNTFASASNKLNSSKPLATFSKTATQNTPSGMTPSLSAQQKTATFSTKVPLSSTQTTSLGITLAPVTRQTPSLQNQKSIISPSVARGKQPEASFTSQAPLINYSTGTYRSTQVPM